MTAPHLDGNNSLDGDLLVFDGGAIKAISEEGLIGGFGVLFTDASSPDAQGDFFCPPPETDYDLDDRKSVRLLYAHGLDSALGTTPLAKASFEVQPKGIWFESQLDLTNPVHRQVYGLTKSNQLGFSSGSVAHLVRKVPAGGAMKIVNWPVAELSVTKSPVERRNRAIALKAFAEGELTFEQVAKTLERPPFDIDAVPSVREFCEAVSPSSLKDGSQRSQSAQNAVADYIAITNVLGEAFHSYTSRLVRRTENRFLKSNDALDKGTIQQTDQLLAEMDRVLPAFGSIKDALLGIRRIADLTAAEQKALSERARLELMSFCRISGTTLEEMENAGTTTS